MKKNRIDLFGAFLGKGDDVDALIAKLMASGQSKSSAIAILKANGTIKQDGAHLVMGQAAAKKAKPVKTMLV